MTPAEHIQGAASNLAFADALRRQGGDGTVVGWAATAIFYAAVHAVRAYFSAEGRHIDSHEACKALMRSRRQLDQVRPLYEGLKQLSERARYYLDDSLDWKDYDAIRARGVKVIKGCCALASLAPPDTAPP